MSRRIADPFLPDSDDSNEAHGGGGKPSRRRSASTIATVVLLAMIAVNGVLLLSLSRRALSERLRLGRPAVPILPRLTPPELPAPDRAAAPTAAVPADLGADEKRTIQVFHAASPAVVFITTLAFTEDVFRRNVMAVPQGSGSGFVWDRQGHIVTNFHVIASANAAKVTLDDQSSWEASLVGTAPDKDLAVLKIRAPADKLQPLPLGRSGNLLVGQQALAIGNPFGLDHTLSVGVVSGLDREIKSLAGRPIQGVIQTDAAINPGNSGGPLLDSRGRLIGINTAIFSPSGASAGIGFAVPVDAVQRYVPELIAHGRITRPGLGVQIAEPALARRIGVKGVLVLGVVSEGPADKAGIRASYRDAQSGNVVLGDIIVAVDGKPTPDPDELFRQLDDKQVGQGVTVTVQRGQQRVVVTVTLAALDEQ
jgi:S1-C subfamily serine protease